ncbi:MOSC domain-containing protein [Parasulfitobacter algicola]|uniref:MOSC domain-containing protein n=1 Tax=Parasulfitobacter algicola TaxID=2614809 RepID=A0ABX2IMU8_9RHOB|nr:MOSC domain-containing protein [Sulfitobacter algicola]NSX54211.1 MOSC domain-containing protein [Sulfitobacter algicola]
MPALVPTDFFGTITWLGYVPDRTASLRSQSLQSVTATFAGVEGEDHAGLTRLSCSRVTSQHPRGTVIRNVRQFSMVSMEEMAEVADLMGVSDIQPEWVGASMVIGGLPDFTYLPPSSRLQSGSGTTLVVDMENRPCHLPAKVIDEDLPGFGSKFKAAAKGRRGVTAWVEREGILQIGEKLRLHVPEQRSWKGV